MAPRTAASISASAKTMNGAWPPSSSEIFFTVPAQSPMSRLPTAVEPVKLSLRTSGLLVISWPISAAGPVTTLNTPGGRPARSARRARGTLSPMPTRSKMRVWTKASHDRPETFSITAPATTNIRLQ